MYTVIAAMLVTTIVIFYLMWRRDVQSLRQTETSAQPYFREEDRETLLPKDGERSAIRAAIDKYFEPNHGWVLFEFGTIVHADGATESELEENAKLKLQRFGAVVLGTRTADFNASKLVDGEILIACRDPDIANILVYERGSAWTDAQQTVAGMIGRGRRDADTRFLSVIDRQCAR